MKHQEHPEQLVKERTTELRIVNGQLQEEMTARRRGQGVLSFKTPNA